MKLRAMIFDDDELIRQLLSKVCARHGYEVFTFPDPGLCSVYLLPDCPCPRTMACADIIISDLRMSNVQGLDFVEEIAKKGCKCRHVALMSGLWSEDEVERATRLGCRVFVKPFRLSDVDAWLADIEATVDPARQLAECLGKPVNGEQTKSEQ